MLYLVESFHVLEEYNVAFAISHLSLDFDTISVCSISSVEMTERLRNRNESQGIELI